MTSTPEPTPELERHLRGILKDAIGHAARARALVIFDTDSALASLLVGGYRRALPAGTFLDFAAASHAEVLAAIGALAAGDLVVLVQSSRFDVRAFRFRLELFQRGLAVIEHPHLGRMAMDEIPVYVDALAYDPATLRPLARELSRRIEAARGAVVRCGALRLEYRGAFEAPKRNDGDYSSTKNRGGQFPIGEVFTEAADLRTVEGTVAIFAYGDAGFGVAGCEPPLELDVREGRVVGQRAAPSEFGGILDAIRAEEGEVLVRELGFGLNTALTRERRVTDVGTYERMCGVHLSLGAKHPVYPKAVLSGRRPKFHVDVFAAVDSVEIDGATVFENGRYVV